MFTWGNRYYSLGMWAVEILEQWNQRLDSEKCAASNDCHKQCNWGKKKKRQLLEGIKMKAKLYWKSILNDFIIWKEKAGSDFMLTKQCKQNINIWIAFEHKILLKGSQSAVRTGKFCLLNVGCNMIFFVVVPLKYPKIHKHCLDNLIGQ